MTRQHILWFSFALISLCGLFWFSELPSASLALSPVSNSVPVNLSVTSEGDEGGGGGGGEEKPSGCTDPEADNYDPTAEIDNGTCIYFLPSVSNLRGIFNQPRQAVVLSWDNPAHPRLAGVRIVRLLDRPPFNENDGVIIFQGLSETYSDQAIELNKNYFYGVFAYDQKGRFAAGAVVRVYTGQEPEIIKPPIVPPPGTEPGPEEEIDFEDIFSVLPQATDGQDLMLLPEDFYLIQPGRATVYFGNNFRVNVDGSREMIIGIKRDRVPTVLKTIGISIKHPDSSDKLFSYVLRYNEKRDAYEIRIGALSRNGVFPIQIYIINYYNQTSKKMSGAFVAGGVDEEMTERFFSLIKQGSRPVLITTGAGAGLAQFLLSMTQIRSWYDFYLVLLRFFGLVLGWLGLRRRRRPWGTVYDAVTKQPIDPAVVTLLAGQQTVATAITDIDGRYGFLVKPGRYHLSVNKTNYAFPSQQLRGQESDELYDQLYFGDDFSLTDETTIKLNMPLDPIKFDWNEFAKNKKDYLRFWGKREIWRQRIFLSWFFLGAGLALWQTLWQPSWYSITAVSIYLLIWGINYYWQKKHHITTVRRRHSGEPIPFAIIRVWLADLDQEIKSLTTNQLGRCYLLVRPGDYYLTVEEKNQQGVYEKIYRSGNLKLSKGILSGDIEI